MYWLAHAPANIALIKYMGKKDDNSNSPDNPSLSYTLNELKSTVRLEKMSSKKIFGNRLLCLAESKILFFPQKRKKDFLIILLE